MKSCGDTQQRVTDPPGATETTSERMKKERTGNTDVRTSARKSSVEGELMCLGNDELGGANHAHELVC